MALDAQVKDDPFLADTIEGYRSMPEADHAADVTRLKARLRKQSERRRGAGFYLLRIAAVGAVLVAAWVVLQQFQSSDKAPAIEDVTNAEVQSTPAETATTFTDSLVGNITSQQEAEAPTVDERLAVQPGASAKRKKEGPLVRSNDEMQAFDLSTDAGVAATESSAPPPVSLMDSQLAPAEEADDVIALEEKESVARKSQDLSKTSMPRAQKKADAEPAAGKPVSPPIALRNITGKVTDELGQPLMAEISINGAKDLFVSTDIDGTYSLELPNGSNYLIFSSNFYNDIQVVIGKKDNIDVSLTYSGNFDIDVIGFKVPADAVDVSIGPITPPHPTGGIGKYKMYLDENKLHPEAEKQPRPGYRVVIGFTLQQDGTLTNFTSKGKAPKAYIDETIRLLKAGPRWDGTPGSSASLYFNFK